MEFICVLSVDGSLTAYHVQKNGNDEYKAVLRNGHEQRNGIPPEIDLERKENGWQAQPWHNEIVASLIHAIEANNSE